MILTIARVGANEARTRFKFGVFMNGDEILVKAGSFRIGGQDYTLDEDQTFMFTSGSLVRWVGGYIVRVKADNSIRLLVDEVDIEPGSTIYRFTPDGPYEKLDRLFVTRVPAEAVNLDDVEVRVTEMGRRM